MSYIYLTYHPIDTYVRRVDFFLFGVVSWPRRDVTCVDRCRWRKAWTKPSSTSAESSSTRPTTSTSPNPRPPAWRKLGPDTTKVASPTTDSPTAERDVNTPQRSLEELLSKIYTWAEHSGIWCLLLGSKGTTFEKKKRCVALCWSCTCTMGKGFLTRACVFDGQAWIEKSKS